MRALLLAALLLASGPAWGQMFVPGLQVDGNGVAVQEFLRLGSSKTATMSSTSSQSLAPFNTGVRFVMLVCSAACNVAQGPSPKSANSNDFQLPANTILRLRILPGDGVAFVGTGTIFAVELH